MALQVSSPNSALKGETPEGYEVPAHLLGDTANLHLEGKTYDSQRWHRFEVDWGSKFEKLPYYADSSNQYSNLGPSRMRCLLAYLTVPFPDWSERHMGVSQN